MKKISTYFKKDPDKLSRVINEINTENEWVQYNSIATRKYDGTASAVIDGELYKRYDVKKGKPVPEGAIPCQKADAITGHWPHWVKCDRNDKADQYHFEAFDSSETPLKDGTYELIGPKVQGNPEGSVAHILVRHGDDQLQLESLNFEYIKDFLTNNDIEGIVFYEVGGERMCKIRKTDFGLKR